MIGQEEWKNPTENPSGPSTLVALISNAALWISLSPNSKLRWSFISFVTLTSMNRTTWSMDSQEGLELVNNPEKYSETHYSKSSSVV